MLQERSFDNELQELRESREDVERRLQRVQGASAPPPPPSSQKSGRAADLFDMGCECVARRGRDGPRASIGACECCSSGPSG
jgi:hypothetical protein